MKNALLQFIRFLAAGATVLSGSACHTARPMASEQSQSHESVTSSGKASVPAAPHASSHMKRRYGR
jgi:hypothetical protein